MAIQYGVASTIDNTLHSDDVVPISPVFLLRPNGPAGILADDSELPSKLVQTLARQPCYVYTYAHTKERLSGQNKTRANPYGTR